MLRTIQVTFLKNWKSYSIGEKAGFIESEANQLVADGIASNPVPAKLSVPWSYKDLQPWNPNTKLAASQTPWTFVAPDPATGIRHVYQKTAVTAGTFTSGATWNATEAAKYIKVCEYSQAGTDYVELLEAGEVELSRAWLSNKTRTFDGVADDQCWLRNSSAGDITLSNAYARLGVAGAGIDFNSQPAANIVIAAGDTVFIQFVGVKLIATLTNTTGLTLAQLRQAFHSRTTQGHYVDLAAANADLLIQHPAGVPTGETYVATIDTGEILFARSNQTQYRVFGGATQGLIVHEGTTVAGFPQALAQAGNYSLLTQVDGTNLPGLYLSDGATWNLVKDIGAADLATTYADKASLPTDVQDGFVADVTSNGLRYLRLDGAWVPMSYETQVADIVTRDALTDVEPNQRVYVIDTDTEFRWDTTAVPPGWLQASASGIGALEYFVTRPGFSNLQIPPTAAEMTTAASGPYQAQDGDIANVTLASGRIEIWSRQGANWTLRHTHYRLPLLAYGTADNALAALFNVGDLAWVYEDAAETIVGLYVVDNAGGAHRWKQLELSGAVGGGGGGMVGATSILSHIDTPAAWAAPGSMLAVNTAGTSLEWVSPATGGGGPISLLTLTDTPANLQAANPGDALLVNPSKTGFYFGVAGASQILEMTDTPNRMGNAGQILEVNGAGTALVWGQSIADRLAPLQVQANSNTTQIGALAASTNTNSNNLTSLTTRVSTLEARPVPVTTLVGLTDTPTGAIPAPADMTLMTDGNGALIWKAVAGGGGGATTFLALSDVPNSYPAGSAGQWLRVNPAEDGLEFAVTPAPGTAFIGLTDVPAAMGTAGQELRVNAGATALEFFSRPTPTFVGLAETPAALGQPRQVLVVDSAGTALEWINLPGPEQLAEATFNSVASGTLDFATDQYAVINANQDFALTIQGAAIGDYGAISFVQDAAGGHGLTIAGGTLIGKIDWAPNARTELIIEVLAGGRVVVRSLLDATRGMDDLATVTGQVTVDFAHGKDQKMLTAGGQTNITLAGSTPGRYLLVVKQDAVGARAITLLNAIGTAPTFAQGPGESTVVNLVYDGSSWLIA